VASACFALPLPDQKDQVLPLQVALIRDLRRQVPCAPPEEDPNEDPGLPAWWRENWQAEPTKAEPTTAKLIPIVTTALHIDAVELAQTYIRRWPAQENIIRDCAPLRREIGYLPQAGEVESETSRTTPDPTRKLGKGQ
jgi:hypothetical protein